MIKIRILKIVVLFIFLILQGCGVEKEPVDTKCNGKGKITYSNATYVGECKNGKEEGHGISTYSNGAKYDGQWHNGKREGHGIIIYSDGAKYDGQWENNKKNGTGTYYYKSGSIYTGEWKNDNKEGHGVFTYSDGEKYDGQWKDNKQEGNGKYITQCGIYNGIWKDDKLIEVTNQNSYEEAYTYYNNIRKQAGMIKLKTNGILEEGAQNHSNYITIHDDELEGLEYHKEKKGKEGFTGINASDRAIAQGYFSNNVGEGLSHRKTAKMSINGLMTAIYHRFGILSFTKNEVGIGFTQDSRELTRNFVHNTGNSNLNYLCQHDNYISGRYYYKVCADLGHKIENDDFTNAINDIKKKNPKYVIWPTKNSIDNLYKFSGEVPDPMPDYNQTGYPISIQFNDYYYPNDIKMQSFKLFKNKKEIKETRILTKETDPNKHFSKYEFALFPLNVLEKNTTYNVVFKYKYINMIKSIEWSFKTMK